MELALEAAPVGNIQQEVDIRGSLQFLDSRLRLGQLGPEPANGPLGVIGRRGRRSDSARLRRPGALGRDLAATARFCGVSLELERLAWFSFSWGIPDQGLPEFTKTG